MDEQGDPQYTNIKRKQTGGRIKTALHIGGIRFRGIERY